MALTKVSYSMISGTPVSVIDFGAVGDGTTDDTAAFNLAIAECVATGKTLYAPKPPVSYNLDSNVDITCAFDAGLYQVFSGSGNVTFGTNTGVVHPEWWYSNDLAVAINKAIVAISELGNEGGTIDATNIRGTHTLSTTLIIYGFSTLKFNDQITLKPANATMDLVNIRPGGNIDGGRFNVTDFAYTGAAIRLDTPMEWNKVSIKNLKLKGTFTGPSMTSAGILFKSSINLWHQVTVTVDNVIIDGFGIGIYCLADGTNTFINANNFSNITILDCANGIYLDGIGGVGFGEVVGNLFSNITIQCVATQVYGVYCNGAGNIFNGLAIWDVTGSTIPFQFASNTSGNYVVGFPSNNPIIDNGVRNTFVDVFSPTQLRYFAGSQVFSTSPTTVFTFNSNYQIGTYLFGCGEVNGANSFYSNSAIINWNGTTANISYNQGNANFAISLSGASVVLTSVSAGLFGYWDMR